MTYPYSILFNLALIFDGDTCVLLLPVIRTANTTKKKTVSFQKCHHPQQVRHWIQACLCLLSPLYVRGNNMNLHTDYYIICLLKMFSEIFQNAIP